jgi:hypothetical protein
MAFPAQYLHQALMVVAVKMRAARLEGSHKFLSGLQERFYRSVRSVTVESPSLSRRLSVRPDAEIDDWVIALADRGARLHFDKGVERRPWREIIREKFSRDERWVRAPLAYATRIEIDGAVIGLLSEWTERPASPESGELTAVGWDIVYKQRRFDYVDEAYSVREASQRLCVVLERAEELCARHDWSKYRDIFAGARKTLGGEGQFTPHGGALLDPRLFSNEARVLFEAASTAWVFGGMGTFADMWVTTREEIEEYQRCQGELLTAIDAAIISAVNLGGLA